MKMLKKHKFVILISIVLLSCLLYDTVAMGLDTDSGKLSWFLLGREKIETANSNDNQVVAKVNDTEILKSDLDYAIKMEKLKFEYQKQKYESAKQYLGEEIHETNIIPPQELDSDQILNRLIENEVIYQEAKAQSLDISWEEAENYAKKMRKTQQQIMSGELTVTDMEEYYQIQDMIKDYINGMGVTEDDYWAMTVPIYQKTLSIGKLKASVMSTIQEKNYENPNEHYEQYIRDIKNQYKIQILNK